jgi:hypothetical protein
MMKFMDIVGLPPNSRLGRGPRPPFIFMNKKGGFGGLPERVRSAALGASWDYLR